MKSTSHAQVKVEDSNVNLDDRLQNMHSLSINIVERPSKGDQLRFCIVAK